jgi:diaminopimelate epimerase
MPMRFVKMHGLGNDFLIVNVAGERVDIDRIRQAAPALCDRRFGVGGDGILLLLPSARADFEMRLINADGSEAEMCGNGIRCFGKYIFDSNLKRSEVLTIDTLAGIQRLSLNAPDGVVETVCVDMGEPGLSPEEIPTTLEATASWKLNGKSVPVVREAPLEIDGRTIAVTCVATGNPHCVLFFDRLENVPFNELGRTIERHSAFPQRTNVHFVTVPARNRLQVKVWERGVGPTLACGTGACASLVAAVLNGKADRRACVQLPGGSLEVEWSGENHMLMTGPAEFVYEGEVDI